MATNSKTAATSNSSSSGKKSGGRRSLGVVKKNEKGTVFIQFNKKVEILFDGKKIDLGEYNTLFFTSLEKAEQDLEVRKEKGYLSEQAEKIAREIMSRENVKYIVEANLAAE